MGTSKKPKAAKRRKFSTMVLWDLENLHVSASDLVLGKGHASRAQLPTPILPYAEISRRLQAELPCGADRRSINNLVFADWARFGCYCAEVLQARGKPMQAFAPTRRVKNTADMYMTITAMDELHRKDGARMFILVSGDSDFIPLTTRLLSAGCEVWVVSFRDSAAAVLLGMVDRFIELDSWMPKVKEIVDPTPKAADLPKVSPEDRWQLCDEVRRLLKGMTITSVELAEQLPLLVGHVGQLANVAESAWKVAILRFVETVWQTTMHASYRVASVAMVWNILTLAKLVNYNSSGGHWVWNRDVPVAAMHAYLRELIGDVSE